MRGKHEVVQRSCMLIIDRRPNPKPRECIWSMLLLSRCPPKRSHISKTTYLLYGFAVELTLLTVHT